ncbi:MAG: LysM peptidoglycan-binding domain-containing protein [Cytophagales bacterium]|nr:MAG: LysM peptidoglycan-binding domain-containing protein [Cytophagales bacterium]
MKKLLLLCLFIVGSGKLTKAQDFYIAEEKIALTTEEKKKIEQQYKQLINDTVRFSKNYWRELRRKLHLINQVLKEKKIPDFFQYTALLHQSFLWEAYPEVWQNAQKQTDIIAEKHWYWLSFQVAEKLIVQYNTTKNWRLVLEKNFTQRKDLLLICAYSLVMTSYEADFQQDTILLLPYFPPAEYLDLADIAQAFSLPIANLQYYNDWLRTDVFPTSHHYPILLPMPTYSPNGQIVTGISLQKQYIQTDTLGKKFIYHYVQAGEYLYAIARKYQVEVAQIEQWNNINRNNVLQIGQMLRIEITIAIEEEETTTTIHVVKQGENLYNIARFYGVSIAQICEWNEIDLGGSFVLQQDRELVIHAKEFKPSQTTVKTNTIQTKAAPLYLVPETLHFLGLDFSLSKEVRHDIQQYVNFIWESPAFIRANLPRIKMHIDYVKAILQQEEMPLDFMYLPLLESSLRPDAVSSAYAVGYWQFKSEAAGEVGLLMNYGIDERKHLKKSTLGAIRYLNRSYLYTESWIFSLISYNLGFRGAKEFFEYYYVDYQRLFKAGKVILLDTRTHVYLKKLIAYKIAFEKALAETPTEYLLSTYETKGKTLQQVANEVDNTLYMLSEHNRWLPNGYVPNDKWYEVMILVEKY